MIIHIRLPQCLCRYKKVILFIISAFVVYRLLAVALWPESRHPAGSDDAIDIVYTWVNGSDPLFLTDLDAYLTLTRSARSEAPISSRRGGPVEGDASRARFADKYELKFSLRSLERHAPWFRHVFIVTNGQIPYWLDLDYERVTLVSHEEIFEFAGDLPTFSSPAIEAQLHRIPGISKRFVYFNDDIFLGAPTYRDDFVSDTRGLLVYLAWPVPPCSQDCPWLYVSDGQCDEQCHNAHCQYDGGDCNQADVDVRAQLQAYSDYDVVFPRRDDEYYVELLKHIGYVENE